LPVSAVTVFLQQLEERIELKWLLVSSGWGKRG